MTKSTPCYIIELTRQRTMIDPGGIPQYRREGHPTPFPSQAYPYKTLAEAEKALPKKYFTGAKVWLLKDGILSDPYQNEVGIEGTEDDEKDMS